MINFFKEKPRKAEHSSALISTGAIKGTSRERLFEEVGIESLSDRWYRKKVFFHKICFLIMTEHIILSRV